MTNRDHGLIQQKIFNSVIIVNLLIVLYVFPAFAQPKTALSSLQQMPLEIRTQVASLYSPDPIERGYGAYSLGFMGRKASPSIPLLIEMLQDNEEISGLDREVLGDSPGISARKSLIKLGVESVDPLITALRQGEESNMRFYAAITLGEIKNHRAFEPLLAALADKDAYVRSAAVDAVGKFEDDKALEPLMAALKDKEESVRFNAATSLGRLKDAHAVAVLIDALHDDRFSVRNNAALALGEIKDPKAVEPLILALDDENAGVRSNAATALGAIKDARAVTRLIEKLQETFDGRNVVADALSNIHETFETLNAMLEDQDANVRSKAAMAFGLIKDDRAVEPLLVALKDKEESVRSNAATALGTIKDVRAVNPLLVALKDKEESVRSNAATALTLIKDIRAVESLINALKDKDANTRKIAATTLGEIKNPIAINYLRSLLDDSSFEVRQSAAMALDTMEWHISEQQDRIKYLLAAGGWPALVDIGTPAIRGLIRTLRDASPDVRMQAVDTLGQIGSPKAIKPLLELLVDKDFDVREKTSVTLKKIGWKPLSRKDKIADLIATQQWGALVKIGEPAVEALEATLNDSNDYIRADVVETLGNMKDARFTNIFILLLGDDSDLTRSNAASALNKLGWKPENQREKVAYLLATKQWGALVEIGKPALNSLTNEKHITDYCLKKTIREIRTRSIYLLGKHFKMPVFTCYGEKKEASSRYLFEPDKMTHSNRVTTRVSIWPPPKWSGKDVLDRTFFTNSSSTILLRDINERLLTALRANGYYDYTYFPLETQNGFALVTRLEQYYPDGSYKEVANGRWQANIEPMRTLSFGKYLKALFGANPALYRMIMFVVSDTPIEQRNDELTRAQANEWQSQGVSSLPTTIGMKVFTKRHECTAVIYEFSIIDGIAEPKLQIPGELPAYTHLVMSKIRPELERMETQ